MINKIFIIKLTRKKEIIDINDIIKENNID